MQKEIERQYKYLLVLSYFNQHEEYLISELTSYIGVSSTVLTDMLDNLLEKNLIKYDNNMLQLTFEGRMKLQKSSAEFYDYYDNKNVIDEYLEKAWKLDRVYVPEDF